MPIVKGKWNENKTAKQLADLFTVEQGSIYSFAARHGLRFKASQCGRKLEKFSPPKLRWHKEVCALYDAGETDIRVLCRSSGKTYHAVYRVIQRHKVRLKRAQKLSASDPSVVG